MYCRICAVLLLVQGVAALSISISPEQIERGDQVTISMNDLPDNSIFSIQFEGTFAATPGDAFSFETKNLVLPFALTDGSLSATLRNTETNMLTVRKGGTEVKRVGLSQNGVYSTTDSGSIPAGTFDAISLGGTAAANATSIVTSLTLQGRKSGPVDSGISFVVDGVTDGSVTITILVDGAIALTRTLQIGNPVTVTPTPTATQPGNLLPLNPGWNFISVPRTLAEGHNSVDTVFSGVDKAGHSVYTYNSEIGSWTQLRYGDTVNLLDGIWIYSMNAGYVSLVYSSGVSPSPFTKPLYMGWNTMGFSHTQSLQAKDALVSIQEHWDQILGFDSSLQHYETSIIKNGTGSHSDSNFLYPFKGYWVKMNGNGTFVAPGT